MNNMWIPVIVSLVALSGTIFNVWYNIKGQKKIEQFKQDYDRNKITEDRKHQIAQEAYKSFFTQKLSAYIELSRLKRDYWNEFVLSKKNLEPNNPFEPSAIKQINAIKNYFEKNFIYFSESLVRKFEVWDNSIKDGFFFEQLREYRGNYANEDFSEKQFRKLTFEHELYEVNFSKFMAFIKQIDEDFEALKKRYDL